jgi:diketogulonate reductase-like aldo/keto reductase
VYRNEAGVGKGISQSDLPRSSLYITTKWSGMAPIPQSIDESLERLGVKHVDFTNGDIEGTWREMEQVLKDGKTKSIGVSK